MDMRRARFALFCLMWQSFGPGGFASAADDPAVETPSPPMPILLDITDRDPPSDAVVLFDGKSFDEWKGADNWKPDEDGAFTVKGAIQTKKEFGDCQLHVEFASPAEVKGTGQGRGNNGIGLMGARYEIQVMDSFENPTYPEGQAASVYNQRPPMVNAVAMPGMTCPKPPILPISRECAFS